MYRKFQIRLNPKRDAIPCILAVAVLMAGCKEKEDGLDFLVMAGVLSMDKAIPGGSPGPGTLDTSFNGTGYTVHNNAAGGNGADEGRALAIDATGRTVIAGNSLNAAGDQDMAIWRYNPDGTLDTTFNGIGYVVHNNAGGGNGADAGYSVAIDAGGRIVVAGTSFNGVDNSVALWRYNENGTLDTGFNGTGFRIDNGSPGSDRRNSVTIDASGRIVCTGAAYQDAIKGSDMVIWRYKANGTLDTTFNGLGYVIHNSAAGGSGNDIGHSVAIDASGRIVVAGTSFNGVDNSVALWRYNENGTLDTGFNGTGFRVDNGPPGNDTRSSVTFDASGRIVCTGAAYQDVIKGSDMVIWRYSPNGQLDTTFNGLGYVIHNSAAGGSSIDIGYSLSLDSLGRIVVAGESADAADHLGMTIWRYNPDGTLDTTFNGLGYAVHKGVAGKVNGGGNAVAIDAGGKIVIAGVSWDAALLSADMTLWRYWP